MTARGLAAMLTSFPLVPVSIVVVLVNARTKLFFKTNKLLSVPKGPQLLVLKAVYNYWLNVFFLRVVMETTIF